MEVYEMKLKLIAVILLGIFSVNAHAYNYLTCENGANLDIWGGHPTFNYGVNLSSTEQSRINVAFSRLTAFSDSRISIGSTNDGSYSFGNGQNEIYKDMSVGTANCVISYSYSGTSCWATEADIRFGDEPWTTNDDSTHWPYGSAGRSITGTAVHEGGHCVGMGHTNNLYNMMGSDWNHVTRNGSSTYYGPGEDLSDGLIDLHGKRSTTDNYRDVGATVWRFSHASGAYSAHKPGRLLSSDGSSEKPAVGSYLGQTMYEVVAGETLRMEITLENNGEKNSESAATGFYLSTNHYISSGDRLLGTITYILGRNAPYETWGSVAIPADVTPGNYFLGAYIDHQNVINEVTGTNNVAYYPITVVAQPDLVTINPAVNDATLTPGQSFTISATVKNQGVSNSTSTTLRYYRSTNSIISTLDTEIGTDPVIALAPNAISNESVPVLAPGMDGTWWVGACVDTVSGETNTANQCSTGVQISVTSPDLVVIDPSVDISSLTPGQNFTFTAVVKNEGTRSAASTILRYYRSTNSVISTADTPIGTDFVGSLPPGFTSSENIGLTAPGSDGTWWIGACVDAVAHEYRDSNQCSAGVQINVATPYYTVGGNVSGLASGNSLVLQNNGADDLNVSGNGRFVFPTALVDGSSYAVTVLAQPTSPDQACAVSNGTGTLSGTDVTNVSVVCTTIGYTVGGNAVGLFNGYTVELANNGGDNIILMANGVFAFPTPVPDGNGYAVTIVTQPDHPSHHCSVANDSGTVAGADVTDVSVSCVVDQLFDDVPMGHWAYDFIQTLAMSGITGGCSGNNYCPDGLVSRAQMAIFLERGIQGSDFVPSPATGTMFADVPDTYWAAAWIEQLASDGITGGCGGGNYCPDNIVTRDQMAVFLLRSKYGSSYIPPTASGAMFDDVPIDHWAADWIEQLAVEGVTGGCDASNYCPDAEVSRDQMAVFLVKTFDL
jgi:hypothetical protein